MTVLDTKLRPIALAKLNQYGKTMVLIRQTVGTYDEATGEAPVTTSSTAFKGVLSGPKHVDLANGLVQVGDMYVNAAAMAFPTAPKATDRLTVDLETWTVVNVLVTYSGELPALYKLHIRR